jgi:hypothetical protein
MGRVLAFLSISHLIAAAPLVFRNTGAQVRYVGSKSCMPCHGAIYRKFVQTAMGRSVTRPAVELLAAPVTIRNTKFNREYEIKHEGTDLFQAESQRRDGQIVFETKHKLEFAIGSGENGISFAVRRGDHLFQAPLSYYSAAKRWDLSPGYEDTGEGFNRPIYEECIVCHAGRPQAVPRRDGLYRDPPFTELAIGCENCHGPGQLHVAERANRRPALPDTSIVNPRRLPARLAEDICMQCHQGGDARVLLPGKSYADFRPGTALIDTLAIFGLSQEGKDADLLEHHASMKMSKCYQATNGKLGCLTCHDPHQQPSPAQAPSYLRSKCMECHSERSCRFDLGARRNTLPADNCIGCHMPKRTVQRISHSALTNHRIPSDPQVRSKIPAKPESSPNLPGLQILNAPDSPVRLPLVTRLAAYGELLTRAPGLQSGYFELLDEASRSAGEDPLVLIALGHKALAESKPEAVALLRKAEQKGVPSAILYLDLSEALTQAGQAAESVAALERGQRLFPFSPAIRKHLVLGYIREKTYDKAKVALESYVQDFPEDDFMRGLLRQVHP